MILKLPKYFILFLLPVATVYTASVQPKENVQTNKNDVNSNDNQASELFNLIPVAASLDPPPPSSSSSSSRLKPNKLISDDVANMRTHKMLDYYSYFPYPAMLQQAYQQQQLQQQQQQQQSQLYQQDYYDDFNQMSNDPMVIMDDMLMSRVNRRKPSSSSSSSGSSSSSSSSSNQNSPIFYIRLPPTPYMFVPGMGYISQPPRIQPIQTAYPYPHPQSLRPPAPQLPPPPPPQQSVNPFVNVPIDFIANGKPTNVYQWNGSPPQSHRPPQPQYPSYLPNRPHNRQPPPQQSSHQYRPQKPYLQDSKITHLKGPFLFNGRPEDIFILPNSPQLSPPPQPQYHYHHHPHHQMAYGDSIYTNNYLSNSVGGYNSNPTYNHIPYNSIYSQDPMQSYY